MRTCVCVLISLHCCVLMLWLVGAGSVNINYINESVISVAVMRMNCIQTHTLACCLANGERAAWGRCLLCFHKAELLQKAGRSLVSEWKQSHAFSLCDVPPSDKSNTPFTHLLADDHSGGVSCLNNMFTKSIKWLWFVCMAALWITQCVPSLLLSPLSMSCFPLVSLFHSSHPLCFPSPFFFPPLPLPPSSSLLWCETSDLE